MQAALIQAGLRSPVGKQIVGLVVGEVVGDIVIPLTKAGIKRGGPVIISGVKEGASAVKRYGRKAHKTVIQRYRKPDRSFAVTEHIDEESGNRVVSVSRDLEKEFLQTIYPA